MRIFAIESSCDETAASLVDDGVKEIATVVASSSKIHEQTEGIVPEVAARKQVEYVVPVISEALDKSAKALGLKTIEDVVRGIDAVAVTSGPGLIGSLLVGVEAAKALSLAWGKPLIPVNHLVGHIYGNWLEAEVLPEFPAVVLVVSGGHTDLILMKGHGYFEYLGGTYDDAAGESFDKTARLLGISRYLGGALLSKKAAKCRKNTLSGRLPRPLLHEDNYDFSFSGLKTAVKRLVENEKNKVEVVACEFENAVVDVLVEKTIKAMKEKNVRSVILAGGVSANTQLRSRMKEAAGKVSVFVPPLKYTGDNSAYIASAAYFNQVYKKYEDIQANPSLGVMDKV